MRRLWIDDEKPEPDGWSRARSFLDALWLLKKYEWDVVAVDHDLGDSDNGTGYDLLCLMESGEIPKPKAIAVISWNAVGAKKMLGAIEHMPEVENLGWDLELSTSGWSEASKR